MYLHIVSENEHKQSFAAFPSGYYSNHLFSTLEARHKLNEFYHNKGRDMLKLGCTLPILTKIDRFKILSLYRKYKEKIPEDMVGRPSSVSTRKVVVDENFIPKTTNLCKSLVGIDAGLLHLYSILAGFSNIWHYASEIQRFTLHQNKSRTIEKMLFSYFQKSAPAWKIESHATNGRLKKIGSFSVNGVCNPCKIVFGALVCSYHLICQEGRPYLTSGQIEKRKKAAR